MKLSSRLTILAILTISIISLFYFKPIWRDHLIPFPGNLLVSYFSPWKEESWPGYPTGVPRKELLGFDTARMMGPWRRFITDELKAGRFPVWNPHQFAGAPLLANFQSGLFFPPNLIYLVIPFHIAWTILVVSQPLLASFGMYLLLKSQFVSQFQTTINQFIIIILPSLAYGFSAWMSVWIEWNIHGFVYALLPWALFFIYRRQTILTILTISFIIFAGHPQMALIGITALIIASVVWRKFKWMIAVLSAVMLITLVQWWPAVKYYQQASREQQSSEFVYSKTLFPWSQISQLIAPNFLGNPATGNFRGAANFVETTAYSGIAILGFAIIGLLTRNCKHGVGNAELEKTKRYAIFLFLLISIFVLPNPISLLIGKLNIPILSTSVASRWLMLLPLSVILLAVSGLDQFVDRIVSNSTKKTKFFSERPDIFISSIVILGLISSLWLMTIFMLSSNRFVSLRNLIIPSFIIGLLLLTLFLKQMNKSKPLLLLFLLAILSIGELILFGWKTMPYTEKRFIFPRTPVLEKLHELSFDGSRFAATEGSVLESNFATYYGLYDLSGYDALYPRRIGELVWAAGNDEIPVTDFSRSTVVVPTKQSNARNNLWNLSGVRWIVNKDDMLMEHPGQRSNDLSSDFKLIWEKDKWQIYENLKVFPRAFFISDISPIDQDYSLQDLIPLIIPAEIIFYQSNKVEVSVNAPGDGYLVLTDTFYPGWRASVNSSVMEIFPAFGAFRAVRISKGNQTVRFHYDSL